MSDEVVTPRVVIGGAASGSGKTAIALGLVAALTARGRIVQSFKVGPDFTDSAYLSHVSRRPCRNLDGWMLGTDGVLTSFAQNLGGVDYAVIEGAMGLFDSHGGGDGTSRFPGSTAELAITLAAPVILVLDIAAMGETAAAVALGIKQIDTRLNIIGVILNNVPSDHRRRSVEDAIWSLAKLPVLGALPRIPDVQIPEMRTGLLPLAQNPHADATAGLLASAFARHCNLDLIERLMARSVPVRARPRPPVPATGPTVRFGVAFDEAFSFYYAENLELLQEAGAEIVPFSPLEDRTLPRDLDGIYLGGSVTEAFVPALAGNQSFMESLRRAHHHGVPIYAECGGLLVAARTVTTSDGARFDMAGVVPVDIGLHSGRLRRGYRELQLSADSLIGSAGTTVRGHEFHFGQLVSGSECLRPAYSMHDSDGQPLGCEGWASPTLLASFVHLHFGQNPDIAVGLVASARARVERRLVGHDAWQPAATSDVTSAGSDPVSAPQ